jgi:hypothetical protein
VWLQRSSEPKQVYEYSFRFMSTHSGFAPLSIPFDGSRDGVQHVLVAT